LTGNGIAATQHSVALSWDASTGSGVVGYNVYRGNASGGPYSKINSALDASTAYTDDTVAAGQTYYYVTTAVDESGDESGHSNQAKAVIPTP
jgi:fibronectin type 3 domain-containing protein